MPVRLVPALILVLLAPLASAEPVLENPPTWDTVLYAHPGGFADAVLSPEPVPDDVRMPPHLRSATECRDGLLTAVWRADPASGPANYSRLLIGWDAGMYGNAPLANLTIASGTLEFDWYVQLNGTVGGLREAVLEATLFDLTSLDHEQRGMHSGTPEPYVIATTEPADLSPTLTNHPHVSVHDADGTTVYGFHVQMPLPADLHIGHLRSDIGTPGHGFHLQVVLQGDDVACRSGTTIGREILLHSSPALRPQVRYTEVAPRWIDDVTPFAGDGVMGLAIDLGHPFGSGGLWIPAGPAVQIDGPAALPVREFTTTGSHGAPLEKEGDRWPIDHSHGHPGTVIQSWSLEDAPAGTYTATWTVQDNLQRGEATVTVEFDVSSASDVSACVAEDAKTVCQALAGSPDEQAPIHWAVPLVAIAWCLLRRR